VSFPPFPRERHTDRFILKSQWLADAPTKFGIWDSYPLKRGSGAIVNISSLHAQNGQANAPLYAAAKGAVMAFTKSLAREEAGNGIRANMVAPGPIDTPFWRKAMVGDDADVVIGKRVKSITLGRLGQPEDVAKVIVFLLSSPAAYMTGTSRHDWRR
jgi:2-hydroxycyclohexanecarboxyl-CoA dehydrogenase